MTNRMLIRYDSDDLAHWSWISLDKENRPIGKTSAGGLDALVAAAKGKRSILVIAARSLLITSVELPGGNSRVVAGAIPYALEERLAEDVEHLHFARGERDADGRIPVIAVSKKFLTDLLQRLSEVGLYPVRAVAEPLLLPWIEGELSILIRDDSAVVRTGEAAGFECSVTQLPLLATCLRNEAKTGQFTNIRIWEQDGASDIRPMLRELGGAEETQDQYAIERVVSGFEPLTRLETRPPAINLLRGFEGPGSNQSSRGSWTAAAALFLSAILVYLGTAGYQYYSMHSELQTLAQKSQTLIRETFPDMKRLVESRLVEQARQRLEQRRRAHGQGTDHLLELLLVLGEAQKKDSAIVLKSMEYRENSLMVQLEGKSVAQIEAFKQQLDSGDTSSEILSAVSKDGGGVEARIKMKAGSA